LAHWGIETIPVPVDAEGIRVDALGDVAAVLVTPAHQFPTGVVLSPARRRALLDWAGDERLIIEDDYDAEQRYDRLPVAALHGARPQSVAHTGSTSKSLSPGMRLGWLIAPHRLAADLVAAKHASDLGSPALAQLVLAQLIASGDYERHLRRMRTQQRRRRDALVEALHRHVPQLRIEGVAAGLHILATFSDRRDDIDDQQLARHLEKLGVLVQPLSWHRATPGPGGLLLGYAANPPDRLRAAVDHIAEALRSRPW